MREQTPDTDLRRAVDVFLAERTRLLRVAHRITGDAGTAEEVVQEVWLRWQGTRRSEVQNPPAFLTTATTHVAINVIQSARARHESVVLSTLPDQVDLDMDPTAHAQQSEAVSDGMRVLLERLNARERAAFLLRKAFDYPYDRIAGVLDIGAANARQIVHRAQRKLYRDRGRTADPVEHRRLSRAFVRAVSDGELLALESVLRESVARAEDPGAPVCGAAIARELEGCRSTPGGRSGSR